MIQRVCFHKFPKTKKPEGVRGAVVRCVCVCVRLRGVCSVAWFFCNEGEKGNSIPRMEGHVRQRVCGSMFV